MSVIHFYNWRNKMSNLEKNINNSAYEMTDNEIMKLADLMLDKSIEKYGVDESQEYSQLSSEIKNKLSNDVNNFTRTLPLTSTAINSLVKLGINTREVLEEKNRVKYAKREWEQYL